MRKLTKQEQIDALQKEVARLRVESAHCQSELAGVYNAIDRAQGTFSSEAVKALYLANQPKEEPEEYESLM